MHLFTTVFGGSYGGKWILFFDGSGSRGGGRSSGWIVGGGGFWSSAAPSNVGLAIAVTAMAGLALAATVVYSRRGSLKSPWSRRRRRHALSPKQWKSLFQNEGKVCDGVKFLKRVRSGGVDPTIRAEVWPFLLGVYDLNSSKEERRFIKKQNRKQYEVLRKQCRQITRRTEKSQGSKELSGYSSELSGDISRTSRECVGYSSECSGDISQVVDPVLEEAANATRPIFNGREDSADCNGSLSNVNSMEDLANLSKDPACSSSSPSNDSKEIGQSSNSAEVEEEEEEEEDDDDSSESTLSDSSESGDLEYLQLQPFLSSGELDGADTDGNPSSSEPDFVRKPHSDEDFATWQRIIRLDAVRANIEFQSQKQTNITSLKARRYAQSVGLKDFDHLESSMVFHAARLVAILEAYALYDPEIGYCQGMSDLLSPILSVVEDDDEAFWCFVGFMKKARHNFRLDEVGIRRQLSIVAKIIRCKDSHLYSHLEMLQAEDCFFVYRMVVVLFRRELSFEQTLCLWEVIWADQAALRAGIAKSAWGRIRPRAPPTEDLLLYAIAASVLQRRKLIIEKYSSMEEIMRECNSMAGQLDVWKLLDDAHDLVVTLHDKV